MWGTKFIVMETSLFHRTPHRWHWFLAHEHCYGLAIQSAETGGGLVRINRVIIKIAADIVGSGHVATLMHTHTRSAATERSNLYMCVCFAHEPCVRITYIQDVLEFTC